MAKHQEIQTELLRRVTRGEWPPGASIPHEAALAEEFGVTRPTIARALRGLVDSGLIERKRRAGSRVALRQSAEVVLRIPVVREVWAAGRQVVHDGRHVAREAVESRYRAAVAGILARI